MTKSKAASQQREDINRAVSAQAQILRHEAPVAFHAIPATRSAAADRQPASGAAAGLHPLARNRSPEAAIDAAAAPDAGSPDAWMEETWMEEAPCAEALDPDPDAPEASAEASATAVTARAETARAGTAGTITPTSTTLEAATTLSPASERSKVEGASESFALESLAAETVPLETVPLETGTSETGILETGASDIGAIEDGKRRQRRRPRRRELHCPLHPEQRIFSVSPKHHLYLTDVGQLMIRGLSKRRADELLAAYKRVLPLTNEWIECFWCEDCGTSTWWHVKRHDRCDHSLAPVPRELWAQASGVILPEGNPSVSQFTRRQARANGVQGLRQYRFL